MIILGIETSCDETAAAVLEKQGDRITILSNVIASSAALQAKYGGIIPEQAAREQIKAIIPVIETAINDSRLTIDDIDAIAVTYGPGLIGSLLVGVETAKTLSLMWDKPLIPVNHLLGHFWANWIEVGVSGKRKGESKNLPKFPCIGLLVSGGHTDLVLFKDEQNYEYLGGTRDDAAGECFDKCARLLGLPYPGGPEISKLARLASASDRPSRDGSRSKRAEKGDPTKFKLPSPMLHSKDFEFSFSGLKTAVATLLPVILSKAKNLKIQSRDPSLIVRDDNLINLCTSIEQAIVDVLVEKTIRAAKKYQVEHIMIAGGVAANQKLTSELKLKIENLKLKTNLHVPSANLCTDNAAMIAARAFFEEAIDPLKLQAEPNLNL